MITTTESFLFVFLSFFIFNEMGLWYELSDALCWLLWKTHFYACLILMSLGIIVDDFIKNYTTFNQTILSLFSHFLAQSQSGDTLTLTLISGKNDLIKISMRYFIISMALSKINYVVKTRTFQVCWCLCFLWELCYYMLYRYRPLQVCFSLYFIATTEHYVQMPYHNLGKNIFLNAHPTPCIMTVSDMFSLNCTGFPKVSEKSGKFQNR